MAGVLYTIFIYPLELLFEVLFNVANDYYDNPAISIVVLSLCINLLLLPLYSNADKLQKKERDLEASIAALFTVKGILSTVRTTLLLT